MGGGVILGVVGAESGERGLGEIGDSSLGKRDSAWEGQREVEEEEEAADCDGGEAKWPGCTEAL